MSRGANKRKPLTPEMLDLTFGFPGEVPHGTASTDMKRLLQFFVEYTRDGNAIAAGLRAGYSQVWANVRSYQYLKKYPDYVRWLQAHAAQQIVKQIAIDQDVVLQEIARIGMLNEYDYLVIEPQPEKDGKPQIPKVRRKRLDELTREQMTAIKVRTHGDKGGLSYTMRDKEGKLTELAKHVGILNEKIILERRTLHLHKHDYSALSMDQLEELERRFEEALQKAGAGRLIEAQ